MSHHSSWTGGQAPASLPGLRKLSWANRVGLAAILVALTSCASQVEPKQPQPLAALDCDDGLKEAIDASPDTRVLLLRKFKQGEPLLLGAADAERQATAVEGTANAPAPVAAVDLCLVKLLVGPGNAGPQGAPSTSEGIGIEILLPSHNRWNQRIRAYGNSGWAGSAQASLSVVASDDIHAAAAAKGFLVATSDHGHVGSPSDASFAMNPDGTVNTVGWKDFSERSLHEVADKTKRVARLYYGRPHQYAYWDGFSTGGRQGHKLAQVYPDDFDGVLAGAPAINWSKFQTAGLYAQVAMKRDLGRLIAPAKLTAATRSAIKACGGEELGFLIDPLSCRYDPTRDVEILCKGSRGKGGVTGRSDASACLTGAEATVINKIWYGQTSDGSAPDPANDNGNRSTLPEGKRVWFGWSRDTDLATTSAGGAPGLILGADQAALEVQDSSFGSRLFKNATGNGKDRWLDALDYAGLADAQAKGLALQPQFANINTDDADLTRFAASGGKMIMYHGFPDEYIPAQGSINYYERVMAAMGGLDAVQRFYRFYLIPGFTHSGRSEGLPGVPVPQPASGRDEMFTALQNWVEAGIAPQTIPLTSSNGAVSLALCAYPQKITYRGKGPAQSAASYTCN